MRRARQAACRRATQRGMQRVVVGCSLAGGEGGRLASPRAGWDRTERSRRGTPIAERRQGTMMVTRRNLVRVWGAASGVGALGVLAACGAGGESAGAAKSSGPATVQYLVQSDSLWEKDKLM